LSAINYKIVFKVDFKPKLDFYDWMFPIASALPDYPDWITNGLSVTLENFDDWCSLSLNHNNFMYIREIEKERRQGADDKRIHAILDTVVPRIDTKEFQRIGLRCWFLYPVEMTFDQLVTLVSQKFLADNSQIREGICPTPIDSAYAVHFMDNDLRVQLRVGPIKRDEMELQFVPNRITNVPVKKRGLPTEELFAELPAVSLLMDIDISRTDVKVDEITKVYGDARALQAKLSQNISKYVFGLKA
jgi:hypothetical protein